MNIEDLGDGSYRLTVEGGKVRDTRNNRVYKTVVCFERNIKYFEAA